MANEEQLTSDAIVQRVNTYGTPLSSAIAFFIGEPSIIQLTYDQYHSLKTTCLDWSTHSGKENNFNTYNSIASAGIIIVNKNNSISHKDYSGNYIYISDNTGLNSTDDYKKIHNVKSYRGLTNQLYVSSFESLTTSNLNFPVTAANRQGSRGSLSEAVYYVNDSDISKTFYNDNINIGEIRLNAMTQTNDVRRLNYQLIDSHVGSLNYFSEKPNIAGGLPLSNYIESNVNSHTNKIEVFVNPNISKNTGSWIASSGDPSVYVRVYDNNIDFNDTQEQDTLHHYLTAINDQAILNAGNNLYNFSKYEDRIKFTTNVGNIPNKLKTAFSKIDNDELEHYDIIVEAGLGTIFAASVPNTLDGDGTRLGGKYTDDSYVEMSGLYTSKDASSENVIVDYNSVASELLTLAEKGKGSLAILDPLRSIFIQSNNNKVLDDETNHFGLNTYWPLKHQFNSINTSYAATFANWFKVYDMTINNQVWVPSSGFMAGQLLLSEQLTYPWTPVGGLRRGVITQINDIALKPSDKEEGQLYKININPIVYRPNEGFILNGQKTLQTKPTAFDRINVRRAFLYFEKIVKDSLKYFVFKQNTLQTRYQIISVITPLFELAKQSNPQGIFDYKIICDKTNNTPDIIDNNELVVDIFIQPVRAAEFILINFHATRTGQDFTEIVQ